MNLNKSGTKVKKEVENVVTQTERKKKNMLKGLSLSYLLLFEIGKFLYFVLINNQKIYTEP